MPKRRKSCHLEQVDGMAGPILARGPLYGSKYALECALLLPRESVFPRKRPDNGTNGTDRVLVTNTQQSQGTLQKKA